MILFDVNVLIYATDINSVDHDRYRAWLNTVINGSSAFGITDLVLSGYLRIVTHPKVFEKPATIKSAFEVIDRILALPNCIPVSPGPRHWGIFRELCNDVNAKGNLVPDAYLAAIAIESGCEWYSTDRDFSRFEGLRWRHPLKSAD